MSMNWYLVEQRVLKVWNAKDGSCRGMLNVANRIRRNLTKIRTFDMPRTQSSQERVYVYTLIIFNLK